MTTRMRLVGWNIQPVIMADDGEELVQVPVQATMIAASKWDEFKQGGDKLALEQLREQVEKGIADPHLNSSS
jgi:hypothetical protein